MQYKEIQKEDDIENIGGWLGAEPTISTVAVLAQQDQEGEDLMILVVAIPSNSDLCPTE